MKIIITENQLIRLVENIIDEQYGNNVINLTDGQVKYYNERWNKGTNVKYTNNNFYKSLMDKANKTRKLTKKQKWFLDFLFTHGQSPYDAGALPTNY